MLFCTFALTSSLIASLHSTDRRIEKCFAISDNQIEHQSILIFTLMIQSWMCLFSDLIIDRLFTQHSFMPPPDTKSIDLQSVIKLLASIRHSFKVPLPWPDDFRWDHLFYAAIDEQVWTVSLYSVTRQVYIVHSSRAPPIQFDNVTFLRRKKCLVGSLGSENFAF